MTAAMFVAFCLANGFSVAALCASLDRLFSPWLRVALAFAGALGVIVLSLLVLTN